jgi:hypothetical protein
MKSVHNLHSPRFPKKAVFSTSLAVCSIIAGAALPAQAVNLLRTNGFTMAGGFATPAGTLDLTNNALIIYSVSGITINNTLSMIAYASDGLSWDRPGITSSTARNDPNGATGLGAFDNSQFNYTNFVGYANVLNGNDPDVLVRYTYYGDANLDGIVNGDDFDLFVLGKTNQADHTWLFGDFNYDGLVNGDDFDLFVLGKTQYGISGPLLAATSGLSGPGVVPEPGVAGLLLVGSLGALASRRRGKTVPLSI